MTRYGRGLEAACKGAAIAGALVFVALVAMSIVSISGRKLASTPVPGDVEMLQLCAAFASSSFFAWCHLNHGDVKVDFFTERLAARQVHALDAVGSLLVAAFGALLAWRTGAGALTLQAAGETTMILGAPVWLGQALMVPGFVLLALAGLYRAADHGQAMRHGTAAGTPHDAVDAAGEAPMSGIGAGLLLFTLLMVLLVLRVPIGIAMFTVGAGGYVWLTGGAWTPLLNSLKNLAYARLSNYDLIVIPLFLLMGQFATHGGLSRSLFRFVSAFMGHWRGGVAMASVGACAGFGAICGSSLATAATMGQVALPELKRLGYAGSLATGTLAAGGTLGIMIPPSVPLVIYAILTQESIGKLFMAAVLPGVIAMLGYMLVIKIVVTWKPEMGPAGPRAAWPERLRTLVAVAPVFGVFAVVIVGIYGGWANPTEAAAIGAAACGVLAVVSGGMRWQGLIDTALGTAQASAMIFLVLLGADQLNTALALSQMPAELAAWVKGSGLPPLLVMVAILVTYILLGCVMDSLAMILLTIPVFYPVVMGLDFWGLAPTDKSIWFGILALMVVEIGLVHPPVGMNVYVINRIAKTVPLTETFKGVVPFLLSDFVRIVVLLFFPALSLVLVRTFQT